MTRPNELEPGGMVGDVLVAITHQFCCRDPNVIVYSVIVINGEMWQCCSDRDFTAVKSFSESHKDTVLMETNKWDSRTHKHAGLLSNSMCNAYGI